MDAESSIVNRQSSISQIWARNDHVVVEVDDSARMTAGGVALPDSSQKRMALHVGNVVAVGPGRFLECGSRPRVDLEVGDRVGWVAGFEVAIPETLTRGRKLVAVGEANVVVGWQGEFPAGG